MYFETIAAYLIFKYSQKYIALIRNGTRTPVASVRRRQVPGVTANKFRFMFRGGQSICGAMKILFSVHKAGLVRTKQGCQLRNMINLLMPSELDHSLRKKKLMPMKQVYKVYITLSAAKENPNSGFLDLPMPLDNLMSLDDFPVPHIQDPQTKSCSCCGDPLDFLTTVEIFNSSGLTRSFWKCVGSGVRSSC